MATHEITYDDGSTERVEADVFEDDDAQIEFLTEIATSHGVRTEIVMSVPGGFCARGRTHRRRGRRPRMRAASAQRAWAQCAGSENTLPRPNREYRK